MRVARVDRVDLVRVDDKDVPFFCRDFLISDIEDQLPRNDIIDLEFGMKMRLNIGVFPRESVEIVGKRMPCVATRCFYFFVGFIEIFFLFFIRFHVFSPFPKTRK